MHHQGRLGVTTRAIQVKFDLQINWLYVFLITGIYLLSPSLQSLPAIKKIWDRVVNILDVSPCGQKKSLEIKLEHR